MKIYIFLSLILCTTAFTTDFSLNELLQEQFEPHNQIFIHEGKPYELKAALADRRWWPWSRDHFILRPQAIDTSDTIYPFTQVVNIPDLDDRKEAAALLLNTNNEVWLKLKREFKKLTPAIREGKLAPFRKIIVASHYLFLIDSKGKVWFKSGYGQDDNFDLVLTEIKVLPAPIKNIFLADKVAFFLDKNGHVWTADLEAIKLEIQALDVIDIETIAVQKNFALLFNNDRAYVYPLSPNYAEAELSLPNTNNWSSKGLSFIKSWDGDSFIFFKDGSFSYLSYDAESLDLVIKPCLVGFNSGKAKIPSIIAFSGSRYALFLLDNEGKLWYARESLIEKGKKTEERCSIRIRDIDNTGCPWEIQLPSDFNLLPPTPVKTARPPCNDQEIAPEASTADDQYTAAPLQVNISTTSDVQLFFSRTWMNSFFWRCLAWFGWTQWR